MLEDPYRPTATAATAGSAAAAAAVRLVLPRSEREPGPVPGCAMPTQPCPDSGPAPGPSHAGPPSFLAIVNAPCRGGHILDRCPLLATSATSLRRRRRRRLLLLGVHTATTASTTSRHMIGRTSCSINSSRRPAPLWRGWLFGCSADRLLGSARISVWVWTRPNCCRCGWRRGM